MQNKIIDIYCELQSFIILSFIINSILGILPESQLQAPINQSLPQLTKLNCYSNGAWCIKLWSTLKFNSLIENNAYEERIIEICAYILSYKKRKIFVNKEEKINIAQQYLNNTTNEVMIV